VVNVVQLEDYLERSPEDDIRGKDIVWFAGGYSAYLLYWIRRTKLDTVLKDILNEGTLYVGSSAGSIITSKDQDFAEWIIGGEEPGAGLIPGLDLVNFNFYPHYEESLYDEIKSKFKGKKM